jgi:hypothetical protein
MTSRRMGFARLLSSAVVAALLTLWASPALAGHAGHRTQHTGGPRHGVKKQGKPTTGKRTAGGTGSAAPVTSAAARDS